MTIESGWYYQPENPGWGLRIDAVGDGLFGALYYTLGSGEQCWGLIGTGDSSTGYTLVRPTNRGLPGAVVSGPNVDMGWLGIDQAGDGFLDVRLRIDPPGMFRGVPFSPMPSPHHWKGRLVKLA